MPQPTRSDVHVNRPLTNVSVAWMQENANFVADRVFPNIPVSKQSDLYYVYNKGDFFRDEMQQRAPGTESAGSGYRLAQDPYFARVYALHKDIDDQTRANADVPLNMDRDATIFLIEKAMIKREVDFAQAAFTTGIWDSEVSGNSTAGSGQVVFWNDENSTPIQNIRTAKRTVLEKTGREPNKLTISRDVYDALVDHPDIIDRVKYGQTAGAPAMVNKAALAALFDVDEVLVSNAVMNVANMNADGSIEETTFIMGSNALLTYTPRTAGLLTPTAGYTFSWNGYTGATTTGHVMKKFRMEELESDRVEIKMAYQQKIVSNELGYFFNEVVNNTVGS